MSVNWNPDQLRAIGENGNVIVSAAAGAGKTTVLCERVLRLVCEGTPIDRMLILTFTRAAAGEMKTRIAARLETAAKEAQTEQQRTYFAAQAQLCAAANISTMHAFCKKVVQRHFFRVGVAPSVETMDETESAVLAADVKKRVLAELAENDPMQFRNLVGGFNGAAQVSETVSKLDAFLSAEPDPEAWLEKAEATLRDPESFSKLLAAEWKQDSDALALKLGELSDARDELPPACQNALILLDDILAHARGCLVQTSREAYGAALSAIPTGTLRFPRDLSPSDTARVREAKSDLMALIRKQTERYAVSADDLLRSEREGAKLIAALFSLLRTYRAAYTAEKRERAVLDFDDLEHLTIEILKDERIAAEYRERFDCVIVDEYQDSNRVQEAILSRILRGDNAFFVGDVKQSIYRFRKAEPKLFLDKCRTFTGKEGTRVDLKQNFRCSAAVIDAVNCVFETIMQEPIAGVSYDDAARLYRGSKETGGKVELHVIERTSETDEDSTGDAEAEARFIAETIRARMEAPIYDSKADKTRPCTFGDFAILLRSKRDAAVIAETLARNGIPCYAQLSGGYFDAIEVQLVLNLLRTLDNRRQDIPLLSVLRSPFFDFSDAELIALRLGERKGQILDCLLASDSPKAKHALEMLATWRNLSRRVPMGELIETLLDASQYRARMGALPGGVQRVKNLEALVERARAFDASGGEGVHGFLAFTDAAAKAADLGASQTVTADVVRIMTIHKSKGLEFPVVFLAGTGSLFNRDDEKKPLLLHETLGVGLQFTDELGTRRRTYARHIIANALADASWQEELRVLYVGMTRARSELYLIGCTKNAATIVESLPTPSLPTVRKAQTALKLLLLSLNGYLVPHVHSKSEFAAPEQTPRFETPAADESDLNELRRALEWVYPYPARADLPTKTSVTAQGETEVSFDEPRFGESEDGASLGTRTHAVLSRLPLSPYAEESLQSLVAAVGGLPQKHVVSLRRFLQSPLFARMCASERAEREWSFVRPVPARALTGADDDTPILLQGVIDACFCENGGWILLDYKTDRVKGDPAQHAERHRRQITLYAEALEALTGSPVREAYAVLLGANEAIRML